MSATLLISPSISTAKTVLKDTLSVKLEHNPDLFLINEENESIKIKQIREIGEQLLYRPAKEPYKTFVFFNFEKATIPAQNAFLKNLEEHPDFIKIILHAKSTQGILETILSRCTTVSGTHRQAQLSPEVTKEVTKIWESVTKESYAEIITTLEPYKNRDDALKLCTHLITYLTILLRNNPSKLLTFATQSLLECKDQLEQNANVLLTLEHHFFSIKSFDNT